jgi:hypothetical protein
MWPLAWLRNSRDGDRRTIGEALFNETMAQFKKLKQKPNLRVLAASDDLFDFFKSLAE